MYLVQTRRVGSAIVFKKVTRAKAKITIMGEVKGLKSQTPRHGA